MRVERRGGEGKGSISAPRLLAALQSNCACRRDAAVQCNELPRIRGFETAATRVTSSQFNLPLRNPIITFRMRCDHTRSKLTRDVLLLGRQVLQSSLLRSNPLSKCDKLLFLTLASVLHSNDDRATLLLKSQVLVRGQLSNSK